MRRSLRLARFRSILCPVDFSAQSGDAIRQAAHVARRSGGRLTVLFAYDPVLLAAAAAVYRRRREFVQRTQVELEQFVRRSIGPGAWALALPRLNRQKRSGSVRSANRLRQMAVALRDAMAGALMERDGMQMAAIDALLAANLPRATDRGPRRPPRRRH